MDDMNEKCAFGWKRVADRQAVAENAVTLNEWSEME